MENRYFIFDDLCREKYESNRCKTGTKMLLVPGRSNRLLFRIPSIIVLEKNNWLQKNVLFFNIADLLAYSDLNIEVTRK